MKKAEIIGELHARGELWANESYSKEQLEEYLNEKKEAESMTLDQLLAKIKSRKVGV